MNGIHEAKGSIPFTSTFPFWAFSSMMNNDNLDPEIANLLGISEPDQKPAPAASTPPPAFGNLFKDEGQASESDKLAEEAQRSLKQRFIKIANVLGKANPAFSDKDFYNKVMAGEGSEAAKFHELFSQFLKAQNPEDRSLYRNRVIPAYWDMASRIAERLGGSVSPAKLYFLRFGMVSPNFLSPEQRDLLSKVQTKNNTGEPFYYLDEWIARIAGGLDKISATDEVRKVMLDTSQKKLDKLDKRKGQRDAEIAALRNRVNQLEETESELDRNIKILLRHDTRSDLGGLKACFNADQKRALSDLNDILRRLSVLDRELGKSYEAVGDIDKDLDDLEKSTEGLDKESTVDSQAITTEFNAIRQMAKLCVGRKGNHFPVLLKSYFVASLGTLGIRENVINMMAAVEELDAGLFIRRYREQDNRIVPNVILIPNYGDFGICWQPFEKHNRSTSRGRLAIPIFSKNLTLAVITALGDLRWQVAKEKAQHRWMEEGITGKYYQCFTENKMKGDVKDSFIRDYILWITKESEGVQKLERDVRGIFWRTMPFPNEVKLRLKNRGFVYSELVKRDTNISMSDGY
jgi:prefoldin subunit 5